MLSRLLSSMFGKFEHGELKKFGILSSILGLIIGVYWAMRPIKDSIFSSIVGIDYQPQAKWISLLVIVPLVILYGKLIDLFPRQKMFYVFVAFYGLAAILFAWAFQHPTIGLANTVEDPTRLVGWAWYIYVESFGSLIVALFWAITTDITTEDAAKRGFPLIYLGAQMGNIVGPLFLRAERLGFEHSGPMVYIIAALIFLMGVLMYVFMRVIPASQLVGYQKEHHIKDEKEPGFLEGLKLLFTQPYLMGIFLIITIYEIIVTVFDFHFKAMAKAQFPVEKAMAEYLADYAVWTGIIATACVLLGINNIQRRLGMVASLLLMPILVAVAVVGLKFTPTLAIAFWIMVIAKAVNYALNQPTLKQLYIPTTKETKYKAQAWIEMFGSRGSKAGGSGINAFRGIFKEKYGAAAGITAFLTFSSGISLAMIVGWLFVVVYVAKTYNKAIKEEKVVC